MSYACPCCGGALAAAIAPEDVARRLKSAVLATIMRALASGPKTYAQLAASVYGARDMIDGEKSLQVTLSRLGHQVEAYGWRIVTPGPGNRNARLYLMPMRGMAA